MEMKKAALLLSVSAALFVSLTSTAFAQDGWLHYGGNQWNERHATLTQIDKESVARLVPRRVLQISTPMNGLVGSPIVADGVLYMPASNGWVHAFDLRSGVKLWSFEHKANYGPQSGAGLMSTGFGSGGAPNCCSNQTRAVSFSNGTIFTANIDASVIAIDAKTGKKKWEILGVPKKENPGGIGLGSLVLGLGFLALTSHATPVVFAGAILIAGGNGLMWPLLVALLSDKAGQHQGAVQGLAGSTGAIAAIMGLLLGGVLYAPLQGWLFVLSAMMIFVVGIMALWSRRQPA
jgi:hypothetical protein